MRLPTLSRLGLILFAVLLGACHRGEQKKDAAEYLPVEQMYAVAKQALENCPTGERASILEAAATFAHHMGATSSHERTRLSAHRASEQHMPACRPEGPRADTRE